MFPSILKTANVTIFKNDEPALCKLLTNLTLLSNICKIFEKIIRASISLNKQYSPWETIPLLKPTCN